MHGAEAMGAAGATPPAGVGSKHDARRRLVASITELIGSAREAEWIVEHVERQGAVPQANPDRDREAGALADRRAAGEPLQYVLGRWAFRSLELLVDPRVLIPRPETEQVVEVALDELRRTRNGMDAIHPPVCVDLGTGSGAIALSLAVEGGARHPALQVWATDRSADALEVAAQNLADLSVVDAGVADRVRFSKGTWFEALPADLVGRVDLLVSNPPYVTEAEYPELDPGVRDWEPKSALVAARGAGGVGGMSDIEAIVAGAPRWLRWTGALVVEMAPHQAYAGVDAARRAGFSEVTIERDLAGRLRMLVARR